jgi:hypothetical protein
LNGYLHWFNIIDDPTCECEDGKETVRHFLLVCPLHRRERDKTRRKVGMGGLRCRITWPPCSVAVRYELGEMKGGWRKAGKRRGRGWTEAGMVMHVVMHVQVHVQVPALYLSLYFRSYQFKFFIVEFDMKMEKLLGDPRRVKYTIEFIESIGRFDF